MATPSATLNGKRAIGARASIPAWGLWFADATLDTETTIAPGAAAELLIADLTLRGTILSGGPVDGAGRSQYRIVAGAGGWGKPLAEKAYTSDAGVKLSTVLSEAASECGEAIDRGTIPATRVGPGYVREGDKPASRALKLEVPENWYVGEDGVTRVGRRAAAEFKGKAAHGPIDRARGTVTLAPESIAKLLPGAIVDGLEAVDVEHELSQKGGLRTTIWGKGESTTSRRLEALRKLFEELIPYLKFMGLWEYRIVTQSGERLNLQPVRVSTGMPELERVTVRPGIPGAKAAHTLGSRVVVGFIEGPERPVVLAFEDSEGEGFSPITLSLCGGVLPAARMGDFAGPYPITATSVKVLV